MTNRSWPELAWRCIYHLSLTIYHLLFWGRSADFAANQWRRGRSFQDPGSRRHGSKPAPRVAEGAPAAQRGLFQPQKAGPRTTIEYGVRGCQVSEHRRVLGSGYGNF